MRPFASAIARALATNRSVMTATAGTPSCKEILENAPRLANRVKRFKREHADITATIRRGIAETQAAAGDAGRVEALHDHAVRLLADLVRHRERGLDLVYEAYHVDIGGES